ncbi:MAG TPA: glutathione S-transferase family protein [Caulobacteraceae bacterium]|nr:glutathione S-transferase family protein [Caulobacteraceae bacterium]
MLTIFHNPRTRSARVVWLAEEMGLPYETRAEVLGQPSQDFLAANPVGAFPAVTDDEVGMGESVAIMQYLLARHGPSPLERRYGDPDYADYLEFLIYGEGSMAAFLNPMIFTRFLGGKDDQDNFTIGAVKRLWAGRVARLARQLEGRDYVAGDFSAADISVGYALFLGDSLGVGDYPPAVAAYWDRLKARPGYQKAFARPS